jgi:hypothetical protein
MSKHGEYSPKIEKNPATNQELDAFVGEVGQLFADAQTEALRDLGLETDPTELEAVSVKLGPTELGSYPTLQDAKVAEFMYVPPVYYQQFPHDDPRQPMSPAGIVATTVLKEPPEGEEPIARSLQITHSLHSQPPYVWDASGVQITGPMRADSKSIHASFDTWQDAVTEQYMDDAAQQLLQGEGTVISQAELLDWSSALRNVVRPERLNFPMMEYGPESTIEDAIGPHLTTEDFMKALLDDRS